MKPKRRRRPSLRQRLLERRPEILQRKQANRLWKEEVRKKNWAANAQALHDTYAGEIPNPMARALPMDGVAYHRARLERLLSEVAMFRDPFRGLPQYENGTSDAVPTPTHLRGNCSPETQEGPQDHPPGVRDMALLRDGLAQGATS